MEICKYKWKSVNENSGDFHVTLANAIYTTVKQRLHRTLWMYLKKFLMISFATLMHKTTLFK